MDWVSIEYPVIRYIVEVKYSGDIAITTCRTKRSEEPKIKDNAHGFTQNFLYEADARRYAVSVARELGIPTCIKAN